MSNCAALVQAGHPVKRGRTNEGSEAGAIAAGNHIGRIAVQGGVQPLPLILMLVLAATATAAPKSQPKPRTVTLDVKDAEAREVLQSMRRQCGIRNMIIDPDVPNTAASFYFREVPCETAFKVVLRTYGLATSDVQVLR